jgi:hypothetical protein
MRQRLSRCVSQCSGFHGWFGGGGGGGGGAVNVDHFTALIMVGKARNVRFCLLLLPAADQVPGAVC